MERGKLSNLVPFVLLSKLFNLTPEEKLDLNSSQKQSLNNEKFNLVSFFPRQVEADLSSAQSQREIESLLAKQRSLSQKVCTRCGEGFSLLFNRRLECIDCSLGVCRKCCIWVNKSASDKLTGWRCQSCQKER